MAVTKREGTRLMDRPEYKQKPRPLTFRAHQSVAEAVQAMSARDYGSAVVVDDEDKVIGIVTERDVMKKLVNQDRSATETTLSDIMTQDPRLAHETDDVLDWLRIMSNERFRRLPVVDENGRIKAIFTQGDFVSYTWPDLVYQVGQLTKASLGRNFPYVMICGGIMVYTLLILAVLTFVN